VSSVARKNLFNVSASYVETLNRLSA